MKKYAQFLIVFMLAVAVVGMSWTDPVWAGPKTSEAARPDSEIIITKDGRYTVGGICDLVVKYKLPNLTNKAAVDVPAEQSREVTFPFPDNLYLSGCHVRHYLDNKVQNEMSSEQGDWQVCFGNRPDEKLTIYYYTDEAATAGGATWQALPTIEQDTFVCAPAMYSGVYAPGGIFIPRTGMESSTRTMNQTRTIHVGTVTMNINESLNITKSGSYGAGGICELTVEYYVPNLSDELHVEENVEISSRVPFPDNQGIIYLPGCHVYHYKSSQVVDEVTTDEGKWTICFAAVPGKQTTIYFYYSNSDTKRVTSVWAPLETKTEGGTACADLVNFTGVYAPIGK